jgi:hypothetical protein
MRLRRFVAAMMGPDRHWWHPFAWPVLFVGLILYTFHRDFRADADGLIAEGEFELARLRRR